MESDKILEVAVKAIDAKRGEDIVVLDVSTVSVLADYFVIASAFSERQLNALLDHVVEEVEKAGGVLKRIEGKDSGKWILVDFSDVVVHLFQSGEREFYNLEKLWRDAPMVDVSDFLIEE
ncbi:MAG: ribosome silencing factor [Lactobacillales bacterium]|jgi:ribosome-associated protein|nr:ribosome silencing factor [Lactobacillales bacterium]